MERDSARLNLGGLVKTGVRKREGGRTGPDRLGRARLTEEFIREGVAAAGSKQVVVGWLAVTERCPHLRVARAQVSGLTPCLQPQGHLLLLLSVNGVEVREEDTDQHQQRTSHPNDVLESIADGGRLYVTVAAGFVVAVAEFVTLGGGAAGVVLPAHDIQDQSGPGEGQTSAHLHEEHKECVEHRLVPLACLVLNQVNNVGQHRPREEVHTRQEKAGEKASDHTDPDGRFVDHRDVEEDVQEGEPARTPDDVGPTLADLRHDFVPHRHSDCGGEHEHDEKVLELVLVLGAEEESEDDAEEESEDDAEEESEDDAEEATETDASAEETTETADASLLAEETEVGESDTEEDTEEDAEEDTEEDAEEDAEEDEGEEQEEDEEEDEEEDAEEQ